MSIFDKLTNSIKRKTENNIDSQELSEKEQRKLEKVKLKEQKKAAKVAEEAEYQKTLKKFTDNKATKIGAYYFDTQQNKMLISKTVFKRNYSVISFSDIISCDVNQRGHSDISTTTKKKHGIARAVTGGIIAGGAGAIVGGMTGKSKSTSQSQEYIDHLGLIITLNDGNTFEIPFITTSCKANGLTARVNWSQLQKIQGIITAGINVNEASNETQNSNLDEIKKLKELLDMNAITQEEFDSKKKELLDL